MIYSVLRLFHVELLGLLFPPSGFAGKWSPFGRSIFAAPARGGAPPQACVFSAPGHSCSGALRPGPACSPLRSAPSGRRLRRPLRARAAPLRPLRPQAPPPPRAFPRHPRRPFASLRAGAPFFGPAVSGLSYFRTFFMLFLKAFLIFAMS